jgi:hypothetical protein
VVCDEHQDCSGDQHALSIAMHRQGARSGNARAATKLIQPQFDENRYWLGSPRALLTPHQKPYAKPSRKAVWSGRMDATFLSNVEILVRTFSGVAFNPVEIETELIRKEF